ncbi:selenocysteine-specific elongation factor [Paucidesulfovibrio gracilis DSM 16080]|uniref:Selenocysteine-specific elongation factor n=1 Tax=Paucidesulfovibrio gracilis DSM 16080 TaxID=1121449 RepID=A0A1T4WL70_9BACT|nr:selenocysteine-specific translation elongation factor [Paucidesulfovibrio gracilis]SKA77391.1 selenocysteine-specific elongation factor [Paucidesulfovibrio gracilis DSM 16080]
MPLIMGTAGHIDHGKTTLVKALTGIDCDRLHEEKERGITIELGFAHLDLEGVERIGVVDVPGHERFVKNMVAGAAGIDFVLLTVAADEGLMPQTREHLEICSLLGIDQGLVALTKSDMVEADWLEMAAEEVSAAMEGTFLQGAPVIPVSGRTGNGVDALRTAIAELARSLPERSATDLFRLPVDRVFTMKGFGTVVTGTMLAGSVRLGEELLLYPGERPVKVRGLQSHGQQVEEALAGRRTAVNLSGVDVSDVSRGEVLARPGSLFPATTWDVELTCLPSSPRPLKHRKEIHFHHGGREILARLYFLDRDELLPGESAVCQVRFPHSMVGVSGDRVVVRSFSPLRTVGGGTLINPLAGKIKRRSPQVDVLRKTAAAQSRERVRLRLELAGIEGCYMSQLPVLTGMSRKPLEAALQEVLSKEDALLVDREERRYLSAAGFEELARVLEDFLGAYHKRHPDRHGVGRGELPAAWGNRLPQRVVHFIVERLLKRGRLDVYEDMVRLPNHEASLAADQTVLRETVLKAYSEGGSTPPNFKDVLAKCQVNAKQAGDTFRRLQEEGQLIRVKEEMFYHAPALQEIQESVRTFLRENDEMSAPDFKTLTGLSRKYAIPVLEYLDREKVTVRVGDVRRLRGASAGK